MFRKRRGTRDHCSLKQVVKGVRRHARHAEEDHIDVGGLRLLSRDRNVQRRCEDLLAAQDEYARQRDLIRNLRFPSYRQAEAYNASASEIERASAALQNNMSIEQYIECPDAAREVVRIAQACTSHSTSREPFARAAIIFWRSPDLNYLETQIVMFITAEEYHSERQRRQRRSIDAPYWQR